MTQVPGLEPGEGSGFTAQGSEQGAEGGILFPEETRVFGGNLTWAFRQEWPAEKGNGAGG